MAVPPNSFHVLLSLYSGRLFQALHGLMAQGHARATAYAVRRKFPHQGRALTMDQRVDENTDSWLARKRSEGELSTREHQRFLKLAEDARALDHLEAKLEVLRGLAAARERYHPPGSQALAQTAQWLERIARNDQDMLEEMEDASLRALDQENE